MKNYVLLIKSGSIQPEALVKRAIKTTTCFATLRQIELKSDVAHFTNHVKPVHNLIYCMTTYFFLVVKHTTQCSPYQVVTGKIYYLKCY